MNFATPTGVSLDVKKTTFTREPAIMAKFAGHPQDLANLAQGIEQRGLPVTSVEAVCNGSSNVDTLIKFNKGVQLNDLADLVRHTPFGIEATGQQPADGAPVHEFKTTKPTGSENHAFLDGRLNVRVFTGTLDPSEYRKSSPQDGGSSSGHDGFRLFMAESGQTCIGSKSFMIEAGLYSETTL